MSLVTPAELATFTGDSPTDPQLQPAIDAAEAVLAAYIGTPDLETIASVTLTYPDLPRITPYLALTEGPATVLNSLTVDAVAVDLADLQLNPWAVARTDGELFTKGAAVVIDIDTGWDSGTVPDRVKQAIIVQAAQIKATPSGTNLKSQRIGDWAETYDTSATSAGVTGAALVEKAALLMLRWRRPPQF